MYGDAGDPPTLQTDGRTDRQTDRRTTCNRKTVLCTTVHRAVKQRRNTGIADVIGIADIVLRYYRYYRLTQHAVGVADWVTCKDRVSRLRR